VTTLLGPNGAGKTTLLETVVTIRAPARGELTVLGLSVDKPAERRRIRRCTGFLPQRFGYFAGFTCVEFVEYCAWLKGVPSADTSRLTMQALERVNLTDRASDRMRTLSGGMLRRVGIAQAIVHEPPLVVLDEPTAGLDPQQRIEFRAIIRQLSADTAFLVSTHLVDEVSHLCDTVVVLSEGRIAFHGTPDDLLGKADDNAVGDTAMERAYSAVLAHTGDVR
jgi:ABC-2 type transport system ATP-binding protein